MTAKPGLVDDIQQQLSSLVVLPLPKTWRLHGDERKCLESYDTTQANTTLARIREKQQKKKPNPTELGNLAGDLTGALEPWVELAMVSRIYARYLDPTDLLVSEDPMLVRKHEFTDWDDRTGRKQWFAASRLAVTSDGKGSYFYGGLAEFGISAGQARATGNHISSTGEAFAGAVFASIRGTDWSALTPGALQAFAATVRVAREWIVQSALSEPLRQTLEQETLGLLSLNRRHTLIDALEQHDWPAVWQSVSVSDLYFLGQALVQRPSTTEASESFWKTPSIAAMRHVAREQKDLDALGSIAPALSGCALPRLRRYAPYEDYERYYMPDQMAQRTAELKLYVAWMADNGAWQSDGLEEASMIAADKVLKSIRLRDQYDWSAVIEAYQKLTPENLQ
jgi:hypothetical protein